LLGVELRREPAEVVDGLGVLHSRYPDARSLPVGGYTKDGLGAGQLPPHLPPGQAELVVLDSVHRVAVPDEQGGHLSGRTGKILMHVYLKAAPDIMVGWPAYQSYNVCPVRAWLLNATGLGSTSSLPSADRGDRGPRRPVLRSTPPSAPRLPTASRGRFDRRQFVRRCRSTLPRPSMQNPRTLKYAKIIDYIGRLSQLFVRLPVIC
jgi:hypothetical protein